MSCGLQNYNSPGTTINAAIRVEQLWDELGKTFGLDILCGYSLGSFDGEEDEHVFQSICAEHSAVYSQ